MACDTLDWWTVSAHLPWNSKMVTCSDNLDWWTVSAHLPTKVVLWSSNDVRGVGWTTDGDYR